MKASRILAGLFFIVFAFFLLFTTSIELVPLLIFFIIGFIILAISLITPRERKPCTHACPKCHTQLPSYAKYCGNCGAELHARAHRMLDRDSSN